ncbi:MAG: ketoacyl-ACP synthase III [Planctomycetes bacterium]|nr:ketoacyl-ACP synthase III [Planctomycetota bacterium]
MDNTKIAAILGTGHYVPKKRLTNADLEKIVDTSDEWIVTRTGIKERRIAAPEEATSDLAAEAGRRALEAAGIKADELSLIIVATVTPDTSFPSTACLVQKKLNAGQVPAFDLAAACSGFLYGVELARQMINTGSQKYILVIGAEVLTRITDYEDRGSCVLFGDGAGAAVIGPGKVSGHGIIDCIMGADGNFSEPLALPAGGSRLPASHETIDAHLHYMKIQGRAVYKLAVTHIVEVVRDLLARNQIDPKAIGMYIPHQMNLRIMEAAADRLGITMEQVYVNIEKYGNTSAASIPIALDEAVRNGQVKNGMDMVLVAFGSGLTWVASLLRW